MFSKPQFTEKEITDLHQAYKDAIYEVYYGEKTIRLFIDRFNPQLDLVLEKYNGTSWAFITAYNSYSQSLSAAENIKRHQSLIELVRSHNLTFFDAVGKDKDGIWTPEKSVFIVDIKLENAIGGSLAASIAIGKEFQQNAIVFGELGEAAKLLWL